MGFIEMREGKYRARVRKNGISLSSTFEKQEDAELWAKYKEELIDQISSFDPPMKEMITLQDAIELKINSIKDKSSKKEINDYESLIKYFEKFCHKTVDKITYNELIEHFDCLLKTPIRKGGTQKKDGTGVKKLPAPMTIFRKYAYLSTVFQMLISEGVEIENVALKICQFIRQKIK